MSADKPKYGGWVRFHIPADSVLQSRLIATVITAVERDVRTQSWRYQLSAFGDEWIDESLLELMTTEPGKLQKKKGAAGD